MNEDFRIFLATLYGEAAESSVAAWRAIASVIMNRVHNREWKNLTTPRAVIENSGFDAFKFKNAPYQHVIAAFAPGAPSPLTPRLRTLEDAVRAIYERQELPTTAAVLYFSPKAQAALHVQDPKRYPQAPAWNFGLLREVRPVGILSTDDFRFFAYQKGNA